jgi:hypothetical protein
LTDVLKETGNMSAPSQLDPEPSDLLFPSESFRTGAGVEQLTYFRGGSQDVALFIFLAGGGSLARHAYGHPGSNERDFLDHWLAKEGYSLLAVSYPTDHPVFNTFHPDLTMAGWARSTMAIAKDLMDEHGLPHKVVVSGWSMSGRAARAMNVAAVEAGVDLECFISLSSTPIGQMSPLYPDSAEPDVTDALFWKKGETRQDRGAIGLATQAALAGREVLSQDSVLSHYSTSTPMNFLGEVHRVEGDRVVASPEALLDDLLGSFDFKTYPLTGAIAPYGPTDARHALTDQATWTFINAQKVYWDWLSRPGFEVSDLSRRDFGGLLDIMASLPSRLFRQVEGTHWFFVGEPGAGETVRHIADLHGEARRIRQEVKAVVDSGGSDGTGA